jgi:hypothetical protein
MVLITLASLLTSLIQVPGPRTCRPWPSCALNAPLVASAADSDRQELFEYSDAYATRLTIHRIASYATLPLFAAQVVTGEALLRDRASPPQWAKSAHKPIAYGLAGLFVVNTVTGGLNALETRHDPNADSRAMIHTLLMLVADAGFVFTGLTVESAGTVGPLGRIRTKHRKAALISMGFATIGYAIMLPPFRKD